jgi:glutaconate CoA-transferase subunit B
MAGEVIVIIRQSSRSFVPHLDFRSSVGYGDGPGYRERLGMTGRGPTAVITDLGVLRPDPETCELTLTQVHPGSSADEASDATGWPLQVSPELEETEPPTDEELRALRGLRATLEATA